MSVNLQLLYEHVSWCVWHEGLRIYDNGYPGNLNPVDSIRNGCMKLEHHNDDVRNLISAASSSELAEVLNLIEPRVEDEHQLSQHFRWVAFHETRGQEFRDLLSEEKYNEIRSLYYNHQNHNSDAKYLLSCVSNGYIAGIINSL